MMNPSPHTAPRYESTRAAWENIWDTASVEVELAAVRSARSIHTIETYRRFLLHDGVILEAGSGLSAVVITLRTMGYNVVGLDYAENALHTSRGYDPTLPLLAGDVHALPVASGTLAGYLSFGVLEHFEQGMSGALAEAYRALRPGGTLVLTIPYPNLVYRLVQMRRRLSGTTTLNQDEFYESAYSREALVASVIEAGFVPLCVQPTSHSYTLWGLGGVFRAPGYYETSPLAERLGGLARRFSPWLFNFMTLVVARK